MGSAFTFVPPTQIGHPDLIPLHSRLAQLHFLPAAKPSGPRTVRVVVLVVGGGAVCLNIAQLPIYFTVFQLHKFTSGWDPQLNKFPLAWLRSMNHLWGGNGVGSSTLNWVVTCHPISETMYVFITAVGLWTKSLLVFLSKSKEKALLGLTQRAQKDTWTVALSLGGQNRRGELGAVWIVQLGAGGDDRRRALRTLIDARPPPAKRRASAYFFVSCQILRVFFAFFASLTRTSYKYTRLNKKSWQLSGNCASFAVKSIQYTGILYYHYLHAKR